MQSLNDDLQLDRQIRGIAEKNLAIQNFLKANPAYDYQANIRVITAYLGNQPATQQNLQFALANLKDSLARKSDEQVAEEAAEQQQAEVERQQQAIEQENQRLKAMSSLELKAEIRRQAELRRKRGY